MALLANARKAFNWRLEIAGVNQFEIQKCTPPEVEIEAVEHGDTNYKVKTAGMITVGDMTMEKLRPLPQTDLWAWQWLQQAQNILTGGGQLALGYKRDCVLKEMDASGLVAINRWYCEGVWPKKISQSDFDRMTSDNIVETITFSVDRCWRI